MQPVVIGVDSSRTIQILTRLFGIAQTDISLSRAQLISNFFRLLVGVANISLGFLFLVAVQFVGVTKIRQYAGIILGALFRVAIAAL